MQNFKNIINKKKGSTKMTAKAEINGRDVEYNEEKKVWIYSDDKSEVTKEEQKAEKERLQKIEDDFVIRQNELGDKFEALCKEYDVTMIAGVWWNKEESIGVHGHNSTHPMIQKGLTFELIKRLK